MMTNRILCQVVVGVALAGCSNSSAPSGNTSNVDAAAPPAAVPPGAARGAGVLTRGYNLQRTGANVEETFLTPALVASGSFGKLYCQPVDDELYSQLLYLPGLD